MHHALEIQDILLDIFTTCCSSSSEWRTALARLARTCRAFNEPALDVLWKELPNLSPLARCLPEVSFESSPGRYLFRRPLTSDEWDILRSYTSRVRSILAAVYNGVGLSQESLISLSNPPTTEPLFPNVRDLYIEYEDATKPLLLLPFRSLISLDVHCIDTDSFENSLKSLAVTSPRLTRLSVCATNSIINTIDPNFICRWQNLQLINCFFVSLDVNTLLHLSHLPALTRLACKIHSTLPDQITLSGSPLIFSTLEEFIPHSKFLDPLSRLISQTRLPAVTNISATIRSRPSKMDLYTFFARVQTSGNPHSIRNLGLYEGHDPARTAFGNRLVLGFGDLQPCMAFRHLRKMDINIEWNVELTDGELLTLGSAWPQLEELRINKDCGWNTLDGITPDGLLRLLQRCPSLTRIALAIDTRGCTGIRASPASRGFTVPLRLSYFDVVDSRIDVECVPAVAAFFSALFPRPSDVVLYAWDGTRFQRVARSRTWDKYWELWEDVRKKVRHAVTERCQDQV